jgi:hypothetical protein
MQTLFPGLREGSTSSVAAKVRSSRVGNVLMLTFHDIVDELLSNEDIPRDFPAVNVDLNELSYFVAFVINFDVSVLQCAVGRLSFLQLVVGRWPELKSDDGLPVLVGLVFDGIASEVNLRAVDITVKPMLQSNGGSIFSRSRFVEVQLVADEMFGASGNWRLDVRQIQDLQLPIDGLLGDGQKLVVARECSRFGRHDGQRSQPG